MNSVTSLPPQAPSDHPIGDSQRRRLHLLQGKLNTKLTNLTRVATVSLNFAEPLTGASAPLRSGDDPAHERLPGPRLYTNPGSPLS